MTLLYTSPMFLEHQTGEHPECPERLIQITRGLELSGLKGACTCPSWLPASMERLARVHGPEYIDAVQAFAERGGGQIEADTVCSQRSYEVARHAAGAVCDAVERVVRGEDRTALCLVRPPGHHALANAPMGFCLFGNISVGARIALEELQLDRVLIVDWDVHHGNGTQDTFWEDPRVGFFSIHRSPFYPGTGAADETGGGEGLGTTQNLPVRFGTSREDYLGRFRGALEEFADRMRPQLVLISAGFDSHREDPVGSLGLETEDFIPLTQILMEIANTHAEWRIVSVLEGGYNTTALAASVEVHLRELLSKGVAARS
jgi:acetoin utilization deacetylase AcuC-like enzyme